MGSQQHFLKVIYISWKKITNWLGIDLKKDWLQKSTAQHGIQSQMAVSSLFTWRLGFL